MNNYFRTNKELIFIADGSNGALSMLTRIRDCTLHSLTLAGNDFAKVIGYYEEVVLLDVITCTYSTEVKHSTDNDQVPVEMTLYYRTKDYRGRDLALKVRYFFSTCGSKYIAACDNVLYRVEE